MSLQFTKSASLPAEAGCKTRQRIVLLWPLLRNNNMATNLRRYTSSHDSTRFAECNYEHKQFGRKCETVTADRGKPRRFIMLMVGKLPVAPTRFVCLF